MTTVTEREPQINQLKPLNRPAPGLTLVEMIEDASTVVDFFNKEDEIRRVQRNIKRTIDQTSFNSDGLRREIMNRFMETAKVKFR